MDLDEALRAPEKVLRHIKTRMSNKQYLLLFIEVVLILVICAGGFSGMIIGWHAAFPSKQTITTSTTQNVSGSSTAAQSGSGNVNLGAGAKNSGIIAPNNTGVITQNQVATYTWENQDGWKSIPYGTGENVSEAFVTNLYFTAKGSSILPTSACFLINSYNIPITDAGPVGVSMGYQTSSQSGDTYIFQNCFSTPQANVTMQVYSPKPLIDINAQLNDND